MTTLPRTKFSALALAAVLMGAGSLPALAAESDPAGTPAGPAGAPAGMTTGAPAAMPAGAPAAMTQKAGSHAPVTKKAPRLATHGQPPVTAKTN